MDVAQRDERRVVGGERVADLRQTAHHHGCEHDAPASHAVGERAAGGPCEQGCERERARHDAGHHQRVAEPGRVLGDDGRDHVVGEQIERLDEREQDETPRSKTRFGGCGRFFLALGFHVSPIMERAAPDDAALHCSSRLLR